MSKWLLNLNPEQQEAVQHVSGPMLILAGAGSGKTTVLVSRTGFLIENGHARPEEILVLTFTNKAARELKERVVHKLGDLAAAKGKKQRGLWAGTFHSFGLSLLKQFHNLVGLPKHFGIIDGSDSKQILKELLKTHSSAAREAFDLDRLLNFINILRSGEEFAADADVDYADLARILAPKYEKRMNLLGVVDFEALLLKPIQLFRDHPDVLKRCQDAFRYVMVDEFQDTNSLQMQLIQQMVSSHQNIAVVGDDDQSIYGWRGANIRNILDFPKNYKPCKVVTLERNYRSSENIIRVANEIIKKNQDRHKKVLKPEAKNKVSVLPEVFVYDNEDVEVDEAIGQIRYFQREGFKLDEIAILYRSNSQGALLEGALRRNNVPYSLTGGSAFFERTEVKDIMAYLRSAFRPHEVAFRRVINTPSRSIGDVTLEQLENYSKKNNCGFIKATHEWRNAGVSEKSGEGVSRFLDALEKMSQTLLDPIDTRPIGERLVRYFTDIGYRNYVYNQYKDPQSAEKRWMLVDILGRILEGFVKKTGLSAKTIREFFESMELRDKVDEASDVEAPQKVELLTLHASKGLEFPVVILMGVEEDLLPHRSLGQNVDEERRLFYVGVTRAKERLVLTRTRQRKKFGKIQPVAPSRFLVEIPANILTTFESGFRPVSEFERKSMLGDLFKKLDNQKEKTNLR